jgi:hypothetical protein
MISFLASSFGFGKTLVCFTRNESVDDPNIISLIDREIYFKSDDGNFSTTIWSNGQQQSEVGCELGPDFGIDTQYICGNEIVHLDFPNNAGSITRIADENGVYARQPMVCRDQDLVISNMLKN